MLRDIAHAAELQDRSQPDFFEFDRSNADLRDSVLELQDAKIGDYLVQGAVKLQVWHDVNVDAEYFPQNDFHDIVDISGLYTINDDGEEIAIALLNNAPSVVEIEQYIVNGFERFSNRVYLEN